VEVKNSLTKVLGITLSMVYKIDCFYTEYSDYTGYPLTCAIYMPHISSYRVSVGLAVV
jgi:hypothetical protein